MGDRVWAYWLDGAFYLRGVVGLVNKDGTLDIIYDDGSEELSVAADRIQQAGGAGEQASALLNVPRALGKRAPQ